MIMRADHAEGFFSIQNEPARDERLSLAARGLLVYMLSMSDDWAFNVNGLTKALNISRPTLVKYLKELQAAGYVEIKKEQNARGQFTGKSWTVYEIPQNHSKQNRHTENLTTASTVVKKTDIRKNRHTENLTVKKYQSKEIPNIKKDQRVDTTTRTREKFTPPTLEEVTAYCRERKNNVDPQRWLDHYQSNGWRVGKNHMEDWKAAVRTWERSGFNDTPRKSTPPHPAKTEESKIDEALRIAMQRAEGGAV